ncbi:hypothetical protein BDB01DRAFT_835610 [Pilobolus umbonatus]|nr:hypothetical protein BDB01DRAFT_835610 [Pilobolus umbonatus]
MYRRGHKAANTVVWKVGYSALSGILPLIIEGGRNVKMFMTIDICNSTRARINLNPPEGLSAKSSFILASGSFYPIIGLLSNIKGLLFRVHTQRQYKETTWPKSLINFSHIIMLSG